MTREQSARRWREMRRIDADIAPSLHPVTSEAPVLSGKPSSFKSKPPLAPEAAKMRLFRLSLGARAPAGTGRVS